MPSERSSIPVPRFCQECGFDTYKADNFDRLLAQNARLRKDYERQAASHAIEVAQLRLKLMDVTEAGKSSQAKVERQRAILNRLEAKLRGRSEIPHA